MKIRTKKDEILEEGKGKYEEKITVKNFLKDPLVSKTLRQLMLLLTLDLRSVDNGRYVKVFQLDTAAVCRIRVKRNEESNSQYL